MISSPIKLLCNSYLLLFHFRSDRSSESLRSHKVYWVSEATGSSSVLSLSRDGQRKAWIYTNPALLFLLLSLHSQILSYQRLKSWLLSLRCANHSEDWQNKVLKSSEKQAESVSSIGVAPRSIYRSVILKLFLVAIVCAFLILMRTK